MWIYTRHAPLTNLLKKLSIKAAANDNAKFTAPHSKHYQISWSGTCLLKNGAAVMYSTMSTNNSAMLYLNAGDFITADVHIHNVFQL